MTTPPRPLPVNPEAAELVPTSQRSYPRSGARDDELETFSGALGPTRSAFREGPMPSPLIPARLRNYGRKAAFLLFVVLIVGPPVVGQFFGVRSRYIRRWTMFSGKGVGAVSGTLTRTEADAPPFTPEDRFALAEPVETRSGVSVPPNWMWKIRSEEDLRRMIRRVCREIREQEGTAPTLSLDARIMTRKGWKPVEWGSTDACHAARHPVEPQEEGS